MTIRISNIVNIQLGEVDSAVVQKIANRLTILRSKSGLRTAVFVRVGKDFVELIRMEPQDEQEVTLFFREIIPCSQMRSMECIFNKCTTNTRANIKCRCNNYK